MIFHQNCYLFSYLKNQFFRDCPKIWYFWFSKNFAWVELFQGIVSLYMLPSLKKGYCEIQYLVCNYIFKSVASSSRRVINKLNSSTIFDWIHNVPSSFNWNNQHKYDKPVFWNLVMHIMCKLLKYYQTKNSRIFLNSQIYCQLKIKYNCH